MQGDHASFGKPRLNGQRIPIAHQNHYEFDSTRGLTTVQEWEAFGDALDGRANKFIQENKAFTYTKSPVKSRLVMTASNAQLNFPELAIDTWQVLANESSVSIRYLPTVANFPRKLWKELVTQAAEFKAGESEDEDGGFVPVGSYSGGDLDNANIVYDLMTRGEESFARSQYVLKHTTSVSNSAVGNVSDSGIECIYTTSQLLDEVTGSSWRYPLPGRLQTKISSIGSPSSKDNHLWGWRKLPSTETTSAGFRIEISTEYWLDQWSTFVYSLL